MTTTRTMKGLPFGGVWAWAAQLQIPTAPISKAPLPLLTGACWLARARLSNNERMWIWGRQAWPSPPAGPGAVEIRSQRRRGLCKSHVEAAARLCGRVSLSRRHHVHLAEPDEWHLWVTHASSVRLDQPGRATGSQPCSRVQTLESTFLPPPPPPPPPPRPPCLVGGHPRADKPQAQRTGPEGRDPGRSRPALAASRPTSAHAPSGAPPSKWVPVVGMLGQRLAGLLAGRYTETPACARFFFIPSIFQQGCLMDGLMGTDAPGLLCCGPYAFSSPPFLPPTITDEQQQLLPFQAFMPLSQPALAEAPWSQRFRPGRDRGPYPLCCSRSSLRLPPLARP